MVRRVIVNPLASAAADSAISTRRLGIVGTMVNIEETPHRVNHRIPPVVPGFGSLGARDAAPGKGFGNCPQEKDKEKAGETPARPCYMIWVECNRRRSI